MHHFVISAHCMATFFGLKRDVAANLADGVGMDVQERGDVLQVEQVNDARAAAEQQLVAFAGCGASVRSMRSRIKGWKRYVNKENTEYEKRRKKSAGNVIFVVSLQPVPWYIKNNPPTLIVAGIRKLGYVL